MDRPGYKICFLHKEKPTAPELELIHKFKARLVRPQDTGYKHTLLEREQHDLPASYFNRMQVRLRKSNFVVAFADRDDGALNMHLGAQVLIGGPLLLFVKKDVPLREQMPLELLGYAERMQQSANTRGIVRICQFGHLDEAWVGLHAFIEEACKAGMRSL